MQVRQREIAYEVTVSEELRALVRARSSRGQDLPASEGLLASHEPWVSSPEPARVFSAVKLRADGRRPLRLLAGELLHCTDTVQTDAPAGISEPRSGNSVKLFLTRDGKCVAHFVSEPPEGSALRPVYRSHTVHSAGDLMAMLRNCRPMAGGCPNPAQERGSSDQNRKAMLAHLDGFNRLMKRLEPHLENSLN